MRPGHIAYQNGHLSIAGARLARSLAASEVERIYICHMEDEIHHGDETFHLLLLDGEFLLVGPFVDGGLGAIEALLEACPQIPVERCLVRKVPYRFREPGLLGLRLFPVPGLRFGPISDLEQFHLVIPEDPHGRC